MAAAQRERESQVSWAGGRKGPREGRWAAWVRLDSGDNDSGKAAPRSRRMQKDYEPTRRCRSGQLAKRREELRNVAVARSGISRRKWVLGAVQGPQSAGKGFPPGVTLDQRPARSLLAGQTEHYGPNPQADIAGRKRFCYETACGALHGPWEAFRLTAKHGHDSCLSLVTSSLDGI